MLAVCALVCVVAPVCEEILFRGFIFRSLANWRGPWPAAIATGILFGLVHGLSAPAADLVPLALLGFVLCVVYRSTGSLYPCMAVHLVNNALALGSDENWGAGKVIALMAGAFAVLALLLACGPSSIRPMDARDRLIALLREHALVIGEVVLTSGARASYYVDAKRAILLPDGFAALGELVAAQAGAWGATAVGGMTMGADPIACAALAGGFRGKAFFVRKEVKAHGLARRIEGPPLDAAGPLRRRRGRRLDRRLDAGGDRGAARGGPRDLRRDRGARPPDGRGRGDRGGGGRAVRRAEHDRRRLPGAAPAMRRGLLLDLDDTLIADVPTAAATFEATAAHAASRRELDAAALAAAASTRARELWRSTPVYARADDIQISSWEALWCRFEGEDEDMRWLREWAPSYRRDTWARALADQGIDDPALAEELGERYGVERRARHETFGDVEAALDQLEGAYALALVTNGASCLQREKLAASGLEHRFAAVVVSGELGIGKPDPAIFAHALAALGCRDGVMVGNSLERDVDGALAAGLRAVWVNRFGEARPGDLSQDVPEIATLRDLPAILAGWVHAPIPGSAHVPTRGVAHVPPR